ncbi:MAG TPA: pitrilysin family protein [Chondromyces sp.]|nr:pitrilysin family protein [Chondromyces sp.]
MTLVNETVMNKQGYTIHVVKTDKYKTNTLVFKMKAPLQRENVTKRALLPHVLQSSSEKFPSTSVLRSHLDDLYGASFFVDLAKKGEYHVMSFSVEIANEKFLKDPTPLLEKGIEFLHEVLLRPNIKEGKFQEETVTNEKRSLKQRIQSVYDDKMRYASMRLVEEMCEGEPYAIPANGMIDDINNITPEGLYQYYQQAIAEDEIDLYVIGDVDVEQVDSICSGLFQFKERTPKTVPAQTIANREKEKEIKEPQEVNQGKLNIGYRTNIVYGDPDYFALQVFNGIFGGFSHSKLFINVREKASLAYYAASRLESHKGLMMVMSGIDIKNYDQAVTIIKEQMEAMKKGDITDSEILQTRAVIRNQMLETIDTARGLIEVLYHNVVAKQSIGIDEWLEKVEKTTKDEIVAVASKIELDTIYFLTGLEGA